MIKASKIIQLCGEGVGDPEEGWCVLSKGRVVKGPFTDKSDALAWIKQKGDPHMEVRFGKSDNGEFVFTQLGMMHK